VRGVFDGLQSFGLVVFLVGLPFSEAAKSTGLALAVVGFAGKLVLGHRPLLGRGGVLAALGIYFAAATLSVIMAAPEMRRPHELLTLAMTIFPFLLVLDSIVSRPSRRLFLTGAVLTGAVVASVLWYGSYDAGSFYRLSLGSIENPVPAGEYLAICLVLGTAVLFAEIRAAVVAPITAFSVGSVGVALALTQSRGALLGATCGVAAVVWATIRKRRYVAAVVAIAVAGILAFAAAKPDSKIAEGLDFQSRNTQARLEIWRQTGGRILERPVTGHGLGSFPLLGVTYFDGRVVEYPLNAHNVWINSLAETGILGTGALLVYLVLVLRGIGGSLRRATHPLDRALSIGTLGGVLVSFVAGLTAVSVDAEPGMLFFTIAAIGVSGRSLQDAEVGEVRDVA
jgi:O-antigen ligase